MAPTMNDLSGKRVLDLQPCADWVAFLEQEAAIHKNNRRIEEKKRQMKIQSAGSGERSRSKHNSAEDKMKESFADKRKEGKKSEPRRRSTRYYNQKDRSTRPTFPIGADNIEGCLN